MKKKIILFLLIFAVLGQGAFAVSTTFSDVSQNAWYASYVAQLKDSGIVDAGELFRPADSLNRAELVKMVMTAIDGLDGHVPPANPAFDDVLPGAWYTNYIEAAATLGIVTGYTDANGNLIGFFGPGDTVNRAAATKMLVEAFDLEMTDDGVKIYPDVHSSDWFYEYVIVASQHDVVSGYSNGNFGPSDAVTRAQIAKMVVLGMQEAGLMEVPEPSVEEDEIIPDEEEAEAEVVEEEVIVEPATANPLSIEEVNTPSGGSEVFVAKYAFQAVKEGFNVETVTVVNDITGDNLGDQAEGTIAIKNVIIKFPNEAGELVTEVRSLGSDGKARFSGLSFYAERDKDSFFEVYADLNKVSDIGEILSGEVFRLGLQDINNDDNSFRAVGDITSNIIGYGASNRLAISGAQVQPFTVRKSFPMFSMSSASENLKNGENTLISYDIAAGSAGSVGLARLVFEVNVYDDNGANFSLSDFKLYRGSTYMNNVNIYDATGAQDLRLGMGGGLVDGTSFVIVTFDQEEIISAGDSNTYSLKAGVGNSENNDSVSTRIAQGDESTPLSGLTAVNQPNTGKIYVNGSATAGIFTGTNDFSQTLGSERNIIWSDRSAGPHLYPTVSGGVVTSNSGTTDWTNGTLLDITALTDHVISK